MSGKFLHILKKLLPLLIITPVSFFIAFFLAEKITKYANPQLTFNQAKEVSLRVSNKSDYLPSNLKPNTTTTHIANTFEFSYPVRINSLGYRMDEFNIEKLPDEYRILMLGDSMTFGYGVGEQHNIPSIVKESLNNYLKENGITDKNIQVINAGFADWRSPDTYYLYLKKEGLKLKPDLVIVNYLINNDVADLDETVWEKKDENGLPEKITSKVSYVDGDYTRLKKQYQNWKYYFPVLRNSHLWVLFSTAMETKSPEVVVKIKNTLGIKDKLPLVSEEENYNCLFRKDCSQRMDELFNEFFSVVKATSNIANQNNIPLIAVLLPANPQVTDVAKKLGEDTTTNEKVFSSLEPQNRIKTFLTEKEIKYIDPLPYVTDKNAEKYYYPKDGHPTEEGYAKLSQSIVDFLKDNWKILEVIKN